MTTFGYGGHTEFHYIDFGGRVLSGIDPTPTDDTAPETPDSDPRDDDIGESGLGDADPIGPEDHPAEPE